MYVFACVHARVWEYMCVCACVYAHGCQLLILGVFYHPSSYVLRQGFLLNFELTNHLDWPSVSPGDLPVSTLPILGL